jgi:phosphoribosyl-ATP pyrophosphohydrolase/phosphoribosyl-AMP cyclohydrolase
MFYNGECPIGAKLKFDEKGLIPAVIQDADTGSVLMMAYMNRDSLTKSAELGQVVFFSRSRQCLWHKGAESGNFLNIVSIAADCDFDTLLIKVRLSGAGAACHTGEYSCFFNKVNGNVFERSHNKKQILFAVYDTVADRKENPAAGSYTNYLLDKGIDKILKKVGEESAETIIAAKNNSKEEVIYETADLMYHLSVMLFDRGVKWADIFGELEKRHGE